MAPYTIIFLILFLVLFVMAVINTNKITELRNEWNNRTDTVIPQAESLIMRSPAGTLVPKTPYYVAPMKPAGTPRSDPTDKDGKVTAQLVFLKYDVSKTDVARLKDDIINRRITYVFRADKRTLYELTDIGDTNKSFVETVGSGQAGQTLVFAVKGVDGVTMPFISTNEYPSSNSAAATAQSYDMTIIGIPRYK